MPRLIGLTLCVVFAILLILAISGPHSTLEAQNSLSVPKVLHNFKAANPPKIVPATEFIVGETQKRALADYRGRGVVLNFWATWCAPCVREMPQLDRLNAMICRDNIDVITVSEDRPQQGSGAALIKKFYQINGLKHLPEAWDPKGKMMRRLAVRGLPTTILINAEGLEVGRIIGPAEWDHPKAVDFLRRLLSPKSK